MVAQEWSGHTLNSSVYFEPDEQGLDLFSAYLTSLKKEPIRLLVDLIEEEFRQVKIPLLRGGDRQEIINRNYTKFFRSSKFRFSKTINVIKKERKEEKLLVAGLTNPDLLAPWLNIIEETKTPLTGILSLPIVSEDLMPSFQSEHKCVILVSQQVPSNLRQSVFLNGKLILSRLVPIASFYQGDYAADVIRDIEGTQRYLVSQRIIERSEVISVQILCNKRHFDKLKVKCAEDQYFDYQIHNITEVIDQEKIVVNEEQDFSSALFCYYASRKIFSNHYAGKEEKKYFNHYLSALAIKFASVALIAAGIGLFSTSVVKAFLYEGSTSEMNLLEQKYQSKYNQLFEQKIDSSTSSINMKHVVQAVEKIEKHYLRSPQQMMAMVSKDVALFPDMRVASLEWFLASTANANSADTQSTGKKSNKRSRRRQPTKRKDALFEIVNVQGELLNFDGDYRYALSVIDDFEDTLKVSKKYKDVRITKRPLNIGSSASISGNANTKVNKSGRQNKKAIFAFRVVREVDLNEK